MKFGKLFDENIIECGNVVGDNNWTRTFVVAVGFAEFLRPLAQLMCWDRSADWNGKNGLVVYSCV